MNGLSPALSMAVPVLPRLVAFMSPSLRDSMAGELEALSRKARASDNPVDDVVLGLVAELLGFDSSDQAWP